MDGPLTRKEDLILLKYKVNSEGIMQYNIRLCFKKCIQIKGYEHDSGKIT